MSTHYVACIVCAREAEQSIVMLGKDIKSNTRIVSSFHNAEGSLSTQIGRRAIIRGYQPLVGRSQPFKRGTIKVIRRRDRQQHSGTKSVNPREVSKNVLLAFAVANAGSLQVSIIRYLKEISPC